MRGIEPPTSVWKTDMLASTLHPHKTGVAGFEPANVGVKVLCLTAWRYPIKFSLNKTRKIICNSLTPKVNANE